MGSLSLTKDLDTRLLHLAAVLSLEGVTSYDEVAARVAATKAEWEREQAESESAEQLEIDKFRAMIDKQGKTVEDIAFILLQAVIDSLDERAKYSHADGSPRLHIEGALDVIELAQLLIDIDIITLKEN